MRCQQKIRQICCAIFFLFLSQLLGIFLYGCFPRGNHADAAIVLGSKVYPNGIPSKRLTTRLSAALRLYHQGDVSWIIVSGGTGKEGIDESRVMREWLEQHQVPSDRILLDGAGINTWESAKNAKKFLDQNPHIKTLAIVTSNYHILRTELALRSFNIPVTATRPADFMVDLREPYSVFREWVGIAAYQVRGWMSLSHPSSSPVDKSINF